MSKDDARIGARRALEQESDEEVAMKIDGTVFSATFVQVDSSARKSADLPVLQSSLDFVAVVF